MALYEEQSSLAQETRRAADWLDDCADLAGVDKSVLQALAAAGIRFSLPAGALLFESGAQPDGVYLLASGRLGVKTAGKAQLIAEIEHGELVGEAGWLLKQQRGATVLALRDCELLLFPNYELERIAGQSNEFCLALARLCARRLRRSNRQDFRARRAHVFALVPNRIEIDIAEVATRLVDEFSQLGRTELVWDARAAAHTAAWFNNIESNNEYVVYVADSLASGWTRQCCRQADAIVLLASSSLPSDPWPAGLVEIAAARGARLELALLHDDTILAGAAAHYLARLPVALHHHILERSDVARMARLLTKRGVGLVLSGGGARGFAHLGVIRALRGARVPIDFIGGSSIGAIIAAGVAMEWDDDAMRACYRRCFVDINPINDYTFPFVALTRGRKVSRLLEREYGEVSIEDLRRPYFCISANLTTGKAVEHGDGRLAHALRASVAIPGVMPPVFCDKGVLVDGAVIDNLPVEAMRKHDPGFVIGCDVGADGDFGKQRINILQILMRAGMINSTSTAAAQRELADVLLKPPLDDIDLLDWQAFDRAIRLGYDYARTALEELPGIPRLTPPALPLARPNSLAAELARRRVAGRSGV
jgi:NTE family protein